MSASLDSTLDPMEEIRFRKKHCNTWVEIQKDTHFSFDELEQIMVIFFKIQKRDDRCLSTDLISSWTESSSVYHLQVDSLDLHQVDGPSRERPKLLLTYFSNDDHRVVLNKTYTPAAFPDSIYEKIDT